MNSVGGGGAPSPSGCRGTRPGALNHDVFAIRYACEMLCASLQHSSIRYVRVTLQCMTQTNRSIAQA